MLDRMLEKPVAFRQGKHKIEYGNRYQAIAEMCSNRMKKKVSLISFSKLFFPAIESSFASKTHPSGTSVRFFSSSIFVFSQSGTLPKYAALPIM